METCSVQELIERQEMIEAVIMEKFKILDHAIWRMQMFCRIVAAEALKSATDPSEVEPWEAAADLPGQPTGVIDEIEAYFCGEE